MTARPRDLQKSRARRLGEVGNSLALKSGAANSQYVTFGCALAVGGTTTKFAVGAGEISLGQSLVPTAASGDVIVDAGAATASGQFRKVAVDVKSDGSVVQTVGAIASSQLAATLPATPVDSITVGWLEIPASFVPATTNVTTGMLKAMPYDNGSAL